MTSARWPCQTSWVRSGSATRSISRSPSSSNRQSSTRCALAENSAKLVPRPSKVAPKGCGRPADSRMSALRDQEDRGERRDDEAKLGAGAAVDRRHAAAVADIAAAIEPRVGIEHLAPGAG